MIEYLAHLIIQLIESTGYAGVFILMTLESVLIPIPSEITMPFAGFLASQGKLNFWIIVLTGTFANLTGSLMAYYIGYFLEEAILLKLIEKYGKFILVSTNEYNRALRWFSKYGDRIVFISRLLPAVRTIISLPAGVSKMSMRKFIPYTVIGCFIWSVFLTYIGFTLGENWNSLEQYFRQFQILIGAAFVLGIAWYINHKLKILKFSNKPHDATLNNK